jgi:subtilisin family serine protease
MEAGMTYHRTRVALLAAVMLGLTACGQPPVQPGRVAAGAPALSARLMAASQRKPANPTRTPARRRLANQLIVAYKVPPARSTAQVLDRFPLGNGSVLELHRLPGRETVEAARTRYGKDPNVLFTEANEWKERHDTASPPATAPAPKPPVIFPIPDASNDWTSLQWHLKQVAAPGAWDVTRGDRKVVVAVVDTGVDYTHPNLAGRVIQGPNYAATLYGDAGSQGPGDLKVDWLDGDGHPVRTLPLADADTQQRLELANKNPDDPMDDEGHGTHVAGIIAAGNTSEGVRGLAPNVTVMAVKALGAMGGTDWTVAQSIRYAYTHGAKVINLSLGSRNPSLINKIVCDEARRAGVLIVAAAGNDGEDMDVAKNAHYPALFPSVLTVAATRQDDTIASFSNRGGKIAISAPGQAILSTMPTRPVIATVLDGANPYFDVLSGTSMAAPIVSGVAALVFSQHPEWRPEQVEARLTGTATRLGGAERTTTYGYGLVHAARAVSPTDGK